MSYISDVLLCLCGDVMTGRGVDQALPHPRDPRLAEPGAASAVEYVRLAEAANGPIPIPIDYGYIWGDALGDLRSTAISLRVVNLETSITTSRDFWPKGINYAMSPQNIACLTAAGIDCCVLANNHVLDFGHAGLAETLETLEAAHIAAVGAGRNLAQAQAPAINVVSSKCRILVFAFAFTTSGIPQEWAATRQKPGIDVLPDLSGRTLSEIAERIRTSRRPGDVVVASIHWGANWGYPILPEERAFAHGLIDAAGVDIVYGHSSHHPKAIELYEGKLILYGCGDCLDDYEGISGFEEFRDDLVIVYLPAVDASTGRLARLTLLPFQITRFRLNHVSHDDALWLRDTLNRESNRYGAQFVLTKDDALALE